MTTVAQLEAQVSELNNRVEALTLEAASAREAARAVINPMDPYAASAAANAREREAHQAWKRKMGYGQRPALNLSLETSGEEYERQVAAALKAERDQKAAWQQRTRDNAARRTAAGIVEPDAMARAAADAARQREMRSRGTPVSLRSSKTPSHPWVMCDERAHNSTGASRSIVPERSDGGRGRTSRIVTRAPWSDPAAHVDAEPAAQDETAAGSRRRAGDAEGASIPDVQHGSAWAAGIRKRASTATTFPPAHRHQENQAWHHTDRRPGRSRRRTQRLPRRRARPRARRH